MSKGIVKFYKPEQGWGFIIEDGTNKEYFVHRNSIRQGPISENDRVTFDLEESRKGGMMAGNVILL